MLVTTPMVCRVRQLLLMLTAFVFVGGASSQLARSAEYAAPMVMAGMPCGMMMSHEGMQGDRRMQPCKGMTSDCIKHMGCVTDAALPARSAGFHVAAHVSAIDYWPAWFELADFVRQPEPLPPRTI